MTSPCITMKQLDARLDALFCRVEKRLNEGVYNAASAGDLVGIIREELRAGDVVETVAKKSTRGARLAEDWTLPDDWRKWAVDNGCDKPEHEAAQFRDYWHSQPGQKGVKLAWLATWRNWIRRNYIAPASTRPVTRQSWREWSDDTWKRLLGPVSSLYNSHYRDKVRNDWSATFPGPCPHNAFNPQIPKAIWLEYGEKWNWIPEGGR